LLNTIQIIALLGCRYSSLAIFGVLKLRMGNRFSKIILLIIILGFTNNSFAFFRPDSIYFRPFSHKFSVRALVGIKELSISISNSSTLLGSASKILYKPNNGLIGGVGVSYRNILLSYYFNVPGTELDHDKFGKTNINDYQLSMTTRLLYLSGYHRTYSGFYVSKPNESYPNWDFSQPYPQRPDIKYVTKGVETILNLNPRRYSLNSSLKFTEQQLLSVLSPLIYANYNLFNVSADSSIIPSHLQSNFFNGRKLYKTSFKGWAVMPGLSYNFIKNKWFINPIVFAGIGYMHKDLFFENNGIDKFNDYYFRMSIRLSYGYNSKNFFMGALAEWNELYLPEKNLMIKTENLNLMVVLGFRF